MAGWRAQGGRKGAGLPLHLRPAGVRTLCPETQQRLGPPSAPPGREARGLEGEDVWGKGRSPPAGRLEGRGMRGVWGWGALF